MAAHGDLPVPPLQAPPAILDAPAGMLDINGDDPLLDPIALLDGDDPLLHLNGDDPLLHLNGDGPLLDPIALLHGEDPLLHLNGDDPLLDPIALLHGDDPLLHLIGDDPLLDPIALLDGDGVLLNLGGGDPVGGVPLPPNGFPPTPPSPPQVTRPVGKARRNKLKKNGKPFRDLRRSVALERSGTHQYNDE